MRRCWRRSRNVPDGGAELWITNDKLADIDDAVMIRLSTFDGQVIREWKEPVLVGPNRSECVWRAAADDLDGGPDRYLSVRVGGRDLPGEPAFLRGDQGLAAHAAAGDVYDHGAGDDHTLTVQIRAAVYAYFVNLNVAHEATRFSDNYFDLERGRNAHDHRHESGDRADIRYGHGEVAVKEFHHRGHRVHREN